MINKKTQAAPKKSGFGNRKRNAKGHKAKSRLRPSPSIRQERDELRLVIAELRAENRLLKRNLASLMFEDVVIDKEAILKEAATQPSLEEAIAGLENTLAGAW
jgi:hypothetical protein